MLFLFFASFGEIEKMQLGVKDRTMFRGFVNIWNSGYTFSL